MNNTPPKFNFRDVSKWRAVDLRTTMQIAHRCTKGVNYQGCSKSDIIEGVARPHGYTSDAELFVFMMDSAAKFIPKLKEHYDSEVNRLLNVCQFGQITKS